MNPGQNNPSLADRHAVLADRTFDGHGWHAEAAVLIRDGRIVGLGSRGEVPSDWPQTRLPTGAFLAPGFIDLQVNGGGGVLLNDQPTADGMRAIARAHRRFGTTACLPTLITDTREQMRTAIAAARSIGGSVCDIGDADKLCRRLAGCIRHDDWLDDRVIFQALAIEYTNMLRNHRGWRTCVRGGRRLCSS